MSQQSISLESSQPAAENSGDTLATYGLGRFYFTGEGPQSSVPDPQGPWLGRVVSRQANRYEIITRFGRRVAELSGRLSYAAVDESELPVTGDWVLSWWDRPESASDIGLILELCPRRTRLIRQAPGGTGASQVLAANVERLVVVWPLDRVETEKTAHRTGGHQSYVRWGLVQRFITMARSGGIDPILVLSKADLLPPELQVDVRAQARERWPGLPVLLLGQDDRGANRPADLLALLEPASTAVLVGLSGAGKSTLLNRLDHNAQARTQTISEAVGKGRHTTTHRELYALPSGALIVDSPGIRELGLWGDEDSLEQSFGLLTELGRDCRFADCGHGNEPGCAVRAALDDGRLDAAMLEQYRKQQAELAWLAARQVKAAIKVGRSDNGKGSAGGHQLSDKEYHEATADQRKWKQIAKFQKQQARDRR